jgi:uncharacterized membrane protein YhiD involved in acid resistance
MNMLLGEPLGQTWLQLVELGLAFVLSALIGLEREIRQKSAGFRTYTLVGFLHSSYSFRNVGSQIFYSRTGLSLTLRVSLRKSFPASDL